MKVNLEPLKQYLTHTKGFEVIELEERITKLEKVADE